MSIATLAPQLSCADVTAMFDAITAVATKAQPVGIINAESVSLAIPFDAPSPFASITLSDLSGIPVSGEKLKFTNDGVPINAGYGAYMMHDGYSVKARLPQSNTVPRVNDGIVRTMAVQMAKDCAARVRKGWTQGTYRDDKNRVCALGAIHLVIQETFNEDGVTWDEWGQYFNLLTGALEEATGVRDIPRWNDTPGRTGEYVATFFDAVALWLETAPDARITELALAE